MRKCRLFLGLILLLYTLGSVAQASFFTSEENGQGLGLDFNDLYIENTVYHEGKFIAQEDGLVYELQEDGTYIFLAQLPQSLGRRGILLLDEGKLLYFSGEAFYHLTLSENPNIRPAYEGIFVPKDSISRILADQKHIIYLCYAPNETGEYAIQYTVEKASNHVQEMSNRYIDTIQNLYKEEGLFAYFSAGDNYLWGEVGIYRVLDKALQKLPYGGEDTETLGGLYLRHMLYHPELDAFFGINDSYLYRISKENIDKVAINLNYFAKPFLLDEQGDILMPSPKGYVRIPKETTLDTSNILSVHAFYEPELLFAFQELGKGYQVSLAEYGDPEADIYFENYNNWKDYGSHLPKPLDLQGDEALQAEVAKMYPNIQASLTEGGALHYVPTNVFHYNSSLPRLNLLYHEDNWKALFSESEKLPSTYEEFADFLLANFETNDKKYSLFPPYDTSHELEKLMIHFLFQYQMDCKRIGQSPDESYAKNVLDKLQKLSNLANQEPHPYRSLLRPMEDLLLYPEGWKPLPLQAVENSPYSIQAEMDILYINENSKQPEAARDFLHFVLEHLPLKNKAKLYQDYVLPPEGENNPRLKKTTQSIAELKQVQEALSKGQIQLPHEDAIALQREINRELNDLSDLYTKLDEKDLKGYQAIADKIYISTILGKERVFDEIISSYLFPEEE